MAYVRLQSLTTGRWFVDPRLRPMLVRDAIEHQTSMTEMAVMILREHLGLKHVPNGRRTSPREDDTVLNIALPKDVKRALRSRYDNENDGIRELLSEHYELPAPSRARGAIESAVA